MKEIKQRKERRFLKTLGKVGEILIQEVLLKLGSSLIKKIGGKKTLPSILFLFLSFTLFAQYPATGNKQRLGYQTTGDGLVYRGRAADTVGIKSSGLNNAYFILDTVNNILYNYIKTKGGWKFSNGDTIIINGVTMPFDSITFNTAKDGAVGVGEVEYNDTQGSLIQGLKGGLVTNVIGQQLHQRVNNRTGATLTKGMAVYLSGSQGNRITVAKALGVTDAFSANTFGIVAENIANNQSGYIITEGLIKNINTSALVEDSAVYLSPTVAGGLTSTKPQAPQHTVYIGVCVKSNADSGELFVKILNGQELNELHDVRITSPVDRASLYYRGGLWRDTTAALLTSDTASMLTNYLRSGVAASTYLTQANAASTYLPLTGGTLTGTLNGTNVSLNSNLTIADIIPNNAPSIFTSVTTGPSSSATVRLGLNQSLSGAANMFLGGSQLVGGNATNPNIFFTDSRRAYASIGGIYSGAGTIISGHIVFNTSPNDATTALTERMRIAQDGAITMGGTLGVTGATTLSAPLTVNSSAVFNEGSTDSDFRVESDGNVNMVFVDASTDRVGIGTNAPTKTLDVNGTLVVTGIANFSNQITISGSVSGSNRLLGKNTSNNGIGDVILGTGLTLSPSNVLDANTTDTASLSNRINLKYDKTGGTISGAVTLSTTTATPTSLLGKDGSNVVGTVTTLAQTGLMKAGGTTTNTSSVGIITVAHGLSYTPSQVFVTLAQQSSYVAVCHAITSSNLSFTFYDSTTGIALNNVSVGFFWLAIK